MEGTERNDFRWYLRCTTAILWLAAPRRLDITRVVAFANNCVKAALRVRIVLLGGPPRATCRSPHRPLVAKPHALDRRSHEVMSEQKESSVLFSLKELMNLEEDRIKSEEAQKAAAAAAAEKARVEAERAARDAEEHRIRTEEERRRNEERRSREETARLEAIRQAEIEKARVEAEQKARLEAMAAQQHHERSLAALQQDERKKKLRKLLIGGAIASVLVIGIVTVVAVDSAQKNEARIQAEAARARELEEANKRLEAQFKESEGKMAGLRDQLATAKDEATRLALQKQLEAEQQKQEQLRRGGGGRPAAGGAPASGGGTKAPCNCAPGDPLCSCL